MIDIRLIRENKDLVVERTANRGHDTGVIDEIESSDSEWRALKGAADNLRAERNRLSLGIAEAKKSKDEKAAEQLIAKGKVLDGQLVQAEQQEKEKWGQIESLLLNLANIHSDSSPIGKDENDNPEVRKWGTPFKTSKDVLPHYELPLFDFERGAKLGGHRFTVMPDKLAKLERALINFMLDTHTMNGYREMWLPHLVKSSIMQGTGQLPKFAEDLYHCERDDLWLIPTAEVPLTNLYSQDILEESQLPLYVTAYTPCYRREAGAYQKDIKGMIRQHQFDKVELVKFALPEQSFAELEKMVKDAEGILQKLGLPYRTIELCSGDMGFASAKTYDIEVWMPAQDKYREISSCSNCTDFQARRAGIKFRRKGKLEFAHTLNGSGVAVGRALVAIVENYQEDHVIKVPEVLHKYLQFKEIEF